MSEIHQSPGDRLRFEILLKSLTEGSLNLAVLSDHDMVLDFYGNLFEQSLKAKGETQVEFCYSTNSEKLVQKFNEILSDLTLNQAREKEQKHAPRRYLLFRDSILMQEFELQLLARLVNGFPASNISIILLINSAGSYRNKLEAFGKNLLQWEVKTKAGAPRKPLEDWVAQEDTHEPVLQAVTRPGKDMLDPTDPTPMNESAVSKLLNIPTKTAWRVPSFGFSKSTQADEVTQVNSPTPPASMTDQSSGTFTEPVLHEPEFHATPKAAEFIDPPADVPLNIDKPKRRFPWGMLFLVLLLSAAASAFLYKDFLLGEVESFKKYLLRGTPAKASPAEQSASEIQAAASQAMARAEAEMAASVAQQAASVASQAASVASEALSLASAPPSGLAASAPAVVASAPAEKIDKTEKSSSKVAAAASDQDWVNQLPDNGYVVQLAAFDTLEEIQAFKRSQSAYAQTRIMSPFKKGTNKRYFILVVGPFATKAQADAFMATDALYNKGWLRSSKSVKTQFDHS